MSYSTVATCTKDQAFLDRVTACIAQEQDARGEVSPTSPPNWVAQTLVWPVAGASDIEAAYASALAANNPNPGGDDAVITDQMILSAVQANWPQPAGAPAEAAP